jgi:hypothetical protein
MHYWKVYCMEDRYPGLWQTWFTRQIAAVGWPAQLGYQLHGGGNAGDRAWSVARRYLLEMKRGHRIVVQLSDHRVGRIGTITDVKVEDSNWNPTVPATKEDPEGEQGRLIEVRWDLSAGPLTPNMAVALPKEARLKQGRELRWTVSP